jgi:glutamate racemase
VNSLSIGIFDSGLGGLTVMNAVAKLLPHENIIYLGDTANLPYGSKSKEAILHHCKENSLFLQSLGVKLIIIACHTASIASYKQLGNELRVPVINMITPSLALLESVPKENHIAILGTSKTISSGIYQKMISEQFPSCKLTSIACPLFVPIVEEGLACHPIAKVVAQNYLSPLKKEKVDTLLLGCTHYPILKETIQEILPFASNIIDPSYSCAKQAKKTLEERNLLNKKNNKPIYRFFVSDNPERFKSLAKGLLYYPINLVSLANPSLLKKS